MRSAATRRLLTMAVSPATAPCWAAADVLTAVPAAIKITIMVLGASLSNAARPCIPQPLWAFGLNVTLIRKCCVGLLPYSHLIEPRRQPGPNAIGRAIRA
jgi:hypothetical protein